ncbi:arginyltransferase [Uliginosibacterium gangwonense]|uniref:arginyltransferase n=1 Tax=Uliginosibacterium gangwonense TaxID=392736 RepID=UPI00036B4AD4|nr:arginyltransferase [Uliginosibacterium gangwonense]
MSQLKDLPYSLLQFYATAPYECSYISDRVARSQVATPGHLIDSALYGDLVRHGFRRSGVYTYRPWCDTCQACVPVRIPVERFEPDRSMRRTWKRNQHLEATELKLAFHQDHYDLYRRYQHMRHTGGGMDGDSQDQYTQFLLQSRVDTRLVEFREAGELRMVSIIDCLPDGLSSVYTFFDPDLSQTSLGSFGILWQVETCRRINRPYLYLGYWIRDCAKMNYKRRFRPLEGLVSENWRELTDQDFDLLA